MFGALFDIVNFNFSKKGSFSDFFFSLPGLFFLFFFLLFVYGIYKSWHRQSEYNRARQRLAELDEARAAALQGQ